MIRRKIAGMALALAVGCVPAWAQSGAQSGADSQAKVCLDNALRSIFVQGDVQKGKAFLLDALKADSHYEPALFNLGYVNAMEENIPEARKWLTKYVAIGGSSQLVAEAQRQLAELAHLDALAADPRQKRERDYSILLLRAADFQAMGLPQEALVLCSKAAKAGKNRFEAYALASEICIQAALFDSAKSFLDKAIALAPASEQFALENQKYVIQDAADEVRIRTGVTQLLKAGDYRGAETQLRALCVKHPHETRLQLDLASIYASSGQNEAAKEILTPLATEGSRPAIAQSAKDMLTKIADTEQFKAMLLDENVVLPGINALTEQIRELKHEIGDNSADADKQDNTAQTLQAIQQQAIAQGNQQVANISGLGSLFSMFGANNRRDEVADKRQKIQQLKEQRAKLEEETPKPLAVAVIAMGENKMGVAEMALSYLPDAQRSPLVYFWYGKLRDREGDAPSSADFYSRSMPVLQRDASLIDKARAADLFVQTNQPNMLHLAGALLTTNLTIVFDPKLAPQYKKSARDLCVSGLHGILDDPDIAKHKDALKNAIDWSEKGWRQFADVAVSAQEETGKGKKRPSRVKPKPFSDTELGMEHAQALNIAGKHEAEAQTLEEIYAVQKKTQAGLQELVDTEDNLAKAYIACKNMKKAKQYAELMKSQNVDAADLYRAVGLE